MQQMKTLIICLLLLIIIINPTFAQSETKAQGRVTQISVPVMSITDGKLIKLLMDEFFIPETLVTRMEIIDVGKNGFGYIAYLLWHSAILCTAGIYGLGYY